MSKADWHQEAAILAKALPYMRKYSGSLFVIKLGGAAMGSSELGRLTAGDIALLHQVGIKPIIVHGGGPKINRMLAERNIKSDFHHGLRVTDAETLRVVERVLEEINRGIVAEIKAEGGKALGLCGKNAGIMTAVKLTRKVLDPDSNLERVLDLGFVGEPSKINDELLRGFCDQGIIPVVAPVAVGEGGEVYNVNADTAAGAIAAAMGARRLIMMTDVKGIVVGDELLTSITPDEGRKMLKGDAITGGMHPKLETCLKAVAEGVRGVVIVDGRVQHALLLEIFTQHGVGTLIAS